jgi:hypothetical protein
MVPPRAPSFDAVHRGVSPCLPAGKAGLRPQPQLTEERATLSRLGEVAQSVEHTAENRGVAGSIPALAIAMATPIPKARHER